MKSKLIYLLITIVCCFISCKGDKSTTGTSEPTSDTTTKTDETGDLSGEKDESEDKASGTADYSELSITEKSVSEIEEEIAKRDGDKDGIPDVADECPKIFGKKCLLGCPENDNDCIKDSEDECPEVDGLRSNNGCPETLDSLSNLYFLDIDNDGLGDPNFSKLSAVKLSQYVMNSDDNCPSRKGEVKDGGCPEIAITLETEEVFIEESFSLAIEGDLKANDSYHWYSNDNAVIDNSSMRKAKCTYYSVGKYNIELEVKNDVDGYYSGKSSKDIYVRVKEDRFSELFSPLIKYGNLVLLGNVENVSEDMKNAQYKIEQFTGKKDITLLKGGGIKNSLNKLIRELKSAKRSSSSRIKSLKATNIEYDSSSGKISKFNYEIIK